MLRALASRFLLISYLAILVTASDNDFADCNCDDEGFWSIHNIMEAQRVSDFLIAIAYFSIPIELLWFISCSNFPFKWVLLQFISFIVLCGLTHLLNAWTYYGPHSFQLILSLTIAKFLTALVSCATAITLLTLIPLLLKWKVRELFLKQNVLELDQEVGMMKKQKEASWHVRMLTQEIRKSLDRHTILYTTLVELSKTLDLHNCAVWMPNENRTELHLTHELKGNSKNYRRSIPVNDPDVLEIQGSKGVKVLRPDSALGASSGRELEESGAVAAIRMPMLQVSNFKGGTPELVDTCYAILVLVLPSMSYRGWSHEEMEIVEVVADQVAVALSHALQQARNDAMMASQARNSFQKVMSHGMRRPMHSILGLLSMFQNDNMGFEQRIVTDTLVKTGNVLATLINDVMDISAEDTVRFPLEMRPFRLHSMIKEASCLAKCLCVYKGFDFELDVQSSLPDLVIGDERRAFQVILHMVGYLLDIFDGGGNVIFRVFSESDSEGKSDRMLGMWKTNAPDEFVSVKFDMEMREGSSLSDGASSTPNSSGRRRNSAEAKEGLGFIMCKRLVQVTAVSSGSECLSALSSAENSVRLVVLDIQMPEMDGFEVATRIRKVRSRSWPLIIAVTASAEDNVWERCLQMGMNGMIRKPVLLQGMADELQRVLQRAGEGL
ncbi:hypothetical protein OIU84_027705 [Salix udensis]|uniref:Response regulatory domain-containing protein n=1 Tax=Salix udensis TaxID=889485 RepID=A0AAD6KI34_9ROSI|nr:hypothetical protein OIU84_027705 [Salix udensis]